MSKELIDNIDYNLTRFAGINGVEYQITQYNKNTKRHEYICLTKKQIERIYNKIRKGK